MKSRMDIITKIQNNSLKTTSEYIHPEAIIFGPVPAGCTIKYNALKGLISKTTSSTPIKYDEASRKLGFTVTNSDVGRPISFEV